MPVPVTLRVSLVMVLAMVMPSALGGVVMITSVL